MSSTASDRASSLMRDHSVLRVVGRAAVRSGSLWGLVVGAYVATQATAYASGYPTARSRSVLATEFTNNAGISALVGPARAINTVAGFVEWKCLMVLAIIGAVWGLLCATRLLRGQEDDGRWEILLSGRTTRVRATRAATGGLLLGLVCFGTLSALIVVLIGRDHAVHLSIATCLFFALAILAAPAMFLAVGSLTSQLAPTRRQASAYGVGFLAAAYAIRMVSDSGTGLSWMRWASPLGWIEELQPLSSPRPLALIPIAALSVAAFGAAIVLASRRDLGASWFADRSSARARLGLLNGPLGLTWRMQRGILSAWAVGVVAYGLLLGSIAKSGGEAITSSPSLAAIFARLGVSGPAAYVGIALLIMAVALGFVVAQQVAGVRAEESSGRLDQVLVRTISRQRWLAVRVAVALLALVAGGLLAGVFVWIGASTQHAGLGFIEMTQAGLNLVAPTVFVLGVGVVAFAVLARQAVRITYGVLAWSFLVELLAGVVRVNRWVLDSSVFHQMSAAPAAPVNWGLDGTLVGLGVAMILLGVTAFSRRDILGE